MPWVLTVDVAVVVQKLKDGLMCVILSMMMGMELKTSSKPLAKMDH
jgi:hypothetical protein